MIPAPSCEGKFWRNAPRSFSHASYAHNITHSCELVFVPTGHHRRHRSNPHATGETARRAAADVRFCRDHPVASETPYRHPRGWQRRRQAPSPRLCPKRNEKGRPQQRYTRGRSWGKSCFDRPYGVGGAFGGTAEVGAVRRSCPCRGGREWVRGTVVETTPRLHTRVARR